MNAPAPRGSRARILAWAVGLAGIALIVQGGQGVLRFLGSQEWPSAPGAIVENSPVFSRTTEIRDGQAIRSRTTSVQIAYRFDVRGVSHTGNRIGLQDPAGDDERFFERVAAEYPVGKLVAVYYDPADPTFTVLERRIGTNGYQVLAGVALTAGAAYAAFAPRRPRRIV